MPARPTPLPLIILAATALLCSRAMFAFFRDPEGPNLLVVAVMAAAIYLPSLAFFLQRMLPLPGGPGRVVATIGFQIVVTAGFYVALS